jgi:hypothetical protein
VCDQETSKTRRLKPATGLWKIQPQWVVTPGKQTNKQTYHLPTSIKNIANETKEFKKTLKRFLLDNSFYSMDEFLIIRNNVYSSL